MLTPYCHQSHSDKYREDLLPLVGTLLYGAWCLCDSYVSFLDWASTGLPSFWPMDDLPLIAAKVRERREQLGLTAEELIARMPEGARMSTSNYREIERGQRLQAQPRTIRALAAALSVPEETVRLWYAGQDTAAPEAPARVDPLSVQEMVDRTIAARLAPLEARLALPEERLSELDAMAALLGCLNDDQFRLVATAVAGDARFSEVR